MASLFYPLVTKRAGNLFKVFLLGFGLIISNITAWSQSPSMDKSIWMDSVLNVLQLDQERNADIKSALLDSAFHIAVQLEDTCNQVLIRSYQATFLDNQGRSDSALILLFWANRNYSPQCDSLILMNMYANMTNVFLSLDELGRLDSIGNIALKHWNRNWKKNKPRFIILNNLAISQIQQGKDTAASQYFHQMYAEATKAQDENFIQKSLINLGSFKGFTGDLDSAYYFFNQAAVLAKSINDIDNYLGLLINLSNLDKMRGNYKQAFSKLDSAFLLATNQKNSGIQASVQKARADIYAITNDFKKAYENYLLYDSIHGIYLDDERVKAVTEMMEKYESEKKAREIQQLKIVNLDAELKNVRITKTRNHFIYIGAGILLVALGLWWRLSFVHKSRKAIQREKDISEGLLLNILPASVAEELKIKGKAEAKHFPLATILFSDFKSFTTISESLSAEELVSELNECFKAFDDIITRHGLEKIKTIGDAYMATAAVPDTNSATAKEVVMAGLEMQRFIT
ncbi:MAG TPA: adenylate/guanylate cyclase domain-containing protein, partial [Saprospiraceae bacterium]|nr:adenylate/guanylate cyclase domain-containing protein [Saprospiraceae bacterium]